jgi:hypothetical protein
MVKLKRACRIRITLMGTIPRFFLGNSNDDNTKYGTEDILINEDIFLL